jgi:hypothetical protein
VITISPFDFCRYEKLGISFFVTARFSCYIGRAFCCQQKRWELKEYSKKLSGRGIIKAFGKEEDTLGIYGNE